MLGTLILAAAMTGQFSGSYSYEWWTYSPMNVRPHTIEIRSGEAVRAKEWIPSQKKIVAEDAHGEVVWVLYGRRTKIYGRIEPGSYLWIDSFRHTITVIDEIPPLILYETR